jgi:hypothetical protein
MNGKRLFWALALALPWWGIVNVAIGLVLPSHLALWWGANAFYPSYIPFVFATYWALVVHDRKVAARKNCGEGT